MASPICDEPGWTQCDKANSFWCLPATSRAPQNNPKQPKTTQNPSTSIPFELDFPFRKEQRLFLLVFTMSTPGTSHRIICFPIKTSQADFVFHIGHKSRSYTSRYTSSRGGKAIQVDLLDLPHEKIMHHTVMDPGDIRILQREFVRFTGQEVKAYSWTFREQGFLADIAEIVAYCVGLDPLGRQELEKGLVRTVKDIQRTTLDRHRMMEMYKKLVDAVNPPPGLEVDGVKPPPVLKIPPPNPICIELLSASEFWKMYEECVEGIDADALRNRERPPSHRTSGCGKQERRPPSPPAPEPNMLCRPDMVQTDQSGARPLLTTKDDETVVASSDNGDDETDVETVVASDPEEEENGYEDCMGGKKNGDSTPGKRHWFKELVRDLLSSMSLVDRSGMRGVTPGHIALLDNPLHYRPVASPGC
jgi:hypothetical protein